MNGPELVTWLSDSSWGTLGQFYEKVTENISVTHLDFFFDSVATSLCMRSLVLVCPLIYPSVGPTNLSHFQLRTRNSISGFVRPSVGRSVGRLVGWLVGWLVGCSVEVIESKSGKTRISAPAHPSATGGRVSGLVL